MEFAVLLVGTFGQTNAVFRIYQTFTYARLVDSFRNKFDISDRGSVYFMFTIPGYNKFKVEGDDNVQNMLSLAKSFGLDHIDVLIQMRNNVSGSQLGSAGSPHDGPSNTTDWRTADVEDRTDLLLDYCTHKKKTLLSAGWAFGITKVGQNFFGGAHEFRTVLCKYAVECGFQFKYVKNDSVCVTAVCKFATSKGCEWLIHSRVSASNGIFCLKKFNPVHSCGAAVRTYRNPRTGSDLVSDVIACRVREQPLTHPTDVVFNMKDGYGLDISYRVAWLGVEKARNEVFGDHDMSFDQLRWYNDAVMQNNPHSYIDLDFEQQTGCFVSPVVFGNFLKDLEPQHWSNAYFRGRRYGEIWSNAAESFNSWIREARHLPITQLVDAVRGKIMEQRSKRKVKSMGWVGEICPKMEKILVAAYEDSRSWLVSQSDDNVFEVRSHPSVLVDIGNRSCSCFQWQLNGFPCSHAVVAFRNSGKNIHDAIESFHHIDEYKAAYGGSIHPIPTVGKPTFSVADYLITPLVYKRLPGRSKQKKIPSKGEIAQRIRCGHCGKMGHHNRKTCKEPM